MTLLSTCRPLFAGRPESQPEPGQCQREQKGKGGGTDLADRRWQKLGHEKGEEEPERGCQQQDSRPARKNSRAHGCDSSQKKARSKGNTQEKKQRLFTFAT